MITRRLLLTGAIATLIAPAAALARKSEPGAVSIVAIDLVRPCQGAVGMREVATKRMEIEALRRRPDKLERYLAKEALPVVKGSGGGLFLTDHHHLGRALWDAGFREVHVRIIADLSMHPPLSFWAEMDERGWVHAYDGEGRFIGPERLPRHLSELTDDPYRSLAGAVRRAGGYDKSSVPFAEFRWADFLRARIARSLVSTNFDAALRQALRLAGSPEARDLPGYIGLVRKAA